jgi:hypothetical protein
MQLILKKEIIVDENHSFLLADLPFQPGEKAVVFIVTETDLTEKLKNGILYLKKLKICHNVRKSLKLILTRKLSLIGQIYASDC